MPKANTTTKLDKSSNLKPTISGNVLGPLLIKELIQQSDWDLFLGSNGKQIMPVIYFLIYYHGKIYW